MRAGTESMRSVGTGSLSRNTLLNVGTQVYSVIVAFAALPFIIRGLGADGFGLLTLLWAFVGYFSVVDFGAGQAALRFLSIGAARHDIDHVVQTIAVTVLVSLTVGLASGAIVLGVSFTDVGGVFGTGAASSLDMASGLRLLAIALPAQVLQVSLKSVPMAFNKFGFNAVLQLLSATVQWGGGALIATLGGGFMGVLLLTVISRYVSVFGYIASVLWLVPEIRHGRRRVTREALRPFVSFSGWAMVPQLLGPMLTFVERFIVGSVLSLAWVSYFSVPADTVSRFLVFPLSLGAAASPVFSSNWTDATGREKVKRVYGRSTKLVLLGILPLSLVLGIFARGIFSAWLGPDFAERSSLPLLIMAGGMVFNVLAQIPASFLPAVGRPDLPAKLALVQVPLYCGALVFCTAQWGIVGTAAAWAVKVSTEMWALGWLVRRTTGSTGSVFQGSMLLFLGLAAPTALVLVLVRSAIPSLLWAAPVIALVLGLYAVAAWRWSMTADDRQVILDNLRPIFGVRIHGA